mmetsp:Transcript_11781/g.37499  ORF Transcript_11781/g.37499 Transcript_11781/m.37499 type:complete len:1152 (-) Transcript_11781:382-3837(-)
MVKGEGEQAEGGQEAMEMATLAAVARPPSSVEAVEATEVEEEEEEPLVGAPQTSAKPLLKGEKTPPRGLKADKSPPPGDAPVRRKSRPWASAPAAEAQPAKKMSGLMKVVSAASVDVERLSKYNEAYMAWHERDPMFGSPFHRLCASPSVTAAHVKAIESGLKRSHAAERPDDEGKRPLHVACGNRSATPAFIEAVAGLDPAQLVAESSTGSTPLHEACRAAAKPAVLTLVCKLEPRALAMRDAHGRTPLHVLCSARGKNVELSDLKMTAVVSALEVGSPLAVAVDGDGATPLHCLCANPSASAEMILLVGGLNAAAAKVKAGPALTLEYVTHGTRPGSMDQSRRRADASTAAGAAEDDESKQLDGDAPPKQASESTKDKSRRRSLFSEGLEGLPARLGFKFAVSSFFGVDHRRHSDDSGLLPLHVLCGRPAKVSPDMLKTVARLYPDAAKQPTDFNRRLPLHVLCLNDLSATPQNIAVLTALYPRGVETPDSHNAAPIDLIARYVVERYAPQLIAMYPNKALEALGACQHSLLHYACIIDHDTTEQVVATMYDQLKEKPPLAVYLSLPEHSRERLASTTVVVNLVDKIFTAPSIVAFLFWETVTCIVMVLGFFRLCHLANERLPHADTTNHVELRAWAALTGIHVAHIVVTKILYISRLSRHHKMHYFLTIWNFVDLATVVMWTATIITLEVGKSKDFRVTASVAQLVLPCRFLKLVKGLNQQIGAFVLCLMNVFRAIIPFCAVLFLVMISFANAFETLLGHKQHYDVGEIDSHGVPGAIENEFSTLPHSLFAVIRIGLIGDMDPDVFYDTAAAIFFLVLFLFVVSVVLLNLLIAIVSDAYEATLTNSEAIYLMSRLESAAEMQSMFPPFMFDHSNTAFLVTVSVLLFPFTVVWLGLVTFSRFFEGPQKAQQMHPQRLLAYARPPEEEEDPAAARAKQASREKVLEQSILKALLKLQSDLEDRFNKQSEHVNERLAALEAQLAGIASDTSLKDALGAQNQHLDKLMTRLAEAPVAALPPDVAARLDEIQEAMRALEEDDVVVSAFDEFITPCVNGGAAAYESTARAAADQYAITARAAADHYESTARAAADRYESTARAAADFRRRASDDIARFTPDFSAPTTLPDESCGCLGPNQGGGIPSSEDTENDP